MNLGVMNKLMDHFSDKKVNLRHKKKTPHRSCCGRGSLIFGRLIDAPTRRLQSGRGGGGTYFWRSTAFASPSAEQLYSRSPTRRRPPTRPVGQGRGQKCAGRRAHPSGRGDPGGDAKTHSTQNTGIPTNSYGSPLIRFDFAQRKFVEFCENLKNSTKMIV